VTEQTPLRPADVLAQSDRDDVDAQVEALLEAEALPADLAPQVAEQEPADAADTIERLERDEQAEVLHLMEDQSAADALAHMDPQLAATVLVDLEPPEAARMLSLMAPDDGADLLQALEKSDRAAVLKRMHPKRAAILGKLALYDPETAGGIMTTTIAVVRAGVRIGQAIDHLKRHSLDPAQSDIYCVDDHKRLIGVISLRELLVIDDGEQVQDHMEVDFDRVGPDLDREEVARIFERYDLLTLPVVDEHERVLGMVTIDDVVDIIAAEATEDAFKQVGAGEGEAVYSTVWTKLRGRGPWLLANLLLAQIGTIVLLLYTGLIELIPVIAVVYPIIANQSGNSGHQSMAITLRGIVLGEVRKERVWPLIRREVAFGMLVGLGIGLVFGLAVALVGPRLDPAVSEGIQWVWFGLISAGAMTGAMAVACLVGTSVPLIMQRFGIDPATASSIFVTMLTDAMSYATFLTLVLLARHLIVAG
jgi:magnesium transporter